MTRGEALANTPTAGVIDRRILQRSMQGCDSIDWRPARER